MSLRFRIDFGRLCKNAVKHWDFILEIVSGNDKATACTVAFPDVVLWPCVAEATTVLMLPIGCVLPDRFVNLPLTLRKS